MPPDGDTKPLVDDSYWFAFSKDLVDKALARRDSAAENLQALAKWAWVLYTGSAAVGFTLADRHLGFWSTALISGGGVALLAVYWSAEYVRMPPLVEFDPRAPAEIKKAYARLVRQKQVRLRIAIALSGIAALLVILGLLSASAPSAKSPPGLVRLPGVRSAVAGAPGQRQLALTATVEANQTVHIQAYGADGRKASRVSNLVAGPDGLVQGNVRVANRAVSPISYAMRWTSAEGQMVEVRGPAGRDGAPKSP